MIRRQFRAIIKRDGFDSEMPKLAKEKYSWAEICNNAVDKPYLSSKLKAKDEARYQVNQYAIEHGEPDADSFDCPEEQIEYYCDKFNLFFDYNGNLINDLTKN